MRRAGTRGFTFIEIEIALLVFLVGLLAVLAFAPVGLRSVKLGEKHTQAMNYARHLMETTKALPFAYQSSIPASDAAPSVGIDQSIIPGAQEGYSYRIKVDTLPENLSIHRIEVNIYWKDSNVGGSMATKVYQLVSYSADVP